MKKLILVILILIVASGCEKENEYTIELNDPYEVCGKIVYFSDNSNGKEIRIKNIIDDVKYACKVDKLEEVRDIIGSILYNKNLSRNEILHELSELYHGL